MKKYLPIISVLRIDIFFAVAMLLGYNYEGSESSAIYIIYNIILFIIPISIFFYDLINKNYKFNIRKIIILYFPIIISISYLLSTLYWGVDIMSTTYFLYFILWGIPSLIMGVYLSYQNKPIENISKIIEVIMVIITLAVLKAIINSISSNLRATIGGATYQNVSYMSAFAFGINLYYIFYGNIHNRYSFFTTKFYLITSYIMIFIQILGVLVSGGRGGMILEIIYLVFISIIIIKEKSKRKIRRYGACIFIVMISSLILLPKLLENDIFLNSFSRVFEFISSSGIDWSGTSGRDTVYKEAISYIAQSPIIGYGIFGMFKVYKAFPHNFLLEILLQGGIIYLGIIIIIAALVLKRVLYITKSEPRFMIINIIGIYPLVMLMFSGTYITNAIFLFYLSFIFSYKIKNYKLNL